MPRLVVLLALAFASTAHAEARWQKVSSQVHVDVVANEFRVEQKWRVTGVATARLMDATQHLTLSGRYGVYGDRLLLTTAVPESKQNRGHGADAWAHPVFVPSAMGARARTAPTANGFHASMSEGPFGNGASPVEIHAVADGVEITERGRYSLAKSHTGFLPFDAMYRLGSVTFGRAPLAAAHKAMGELHNHMFNAAEPLVNWVNDHP